MSGRKYYSCKQAHGLLYQLIKKFGLSIMVYYTNLCNNSVIVPWSIIPFKKLIFFINSVTGSRAYSQLKLKKIRPGPVTESLGHRILVLLARLYGKINLS